MCPGIMHLLAAGPSNNAGLLFPSQDRRGTILVILYSMVWDWRVLSTVPMLFFCLHCFHFLFFLSIGGYCGSGGYFGSGGYCGSGGYQWVLGLRTDM